MLLISAFLSGRFLTYLAIRVARATLIRDERLFRKWFQQQRVSIFVKSTGEYVWNDAPGGV